MGDVHKGASQLGNTIFGHAKHGTGETQGRYHARVVIEDRRADASHTRLNLFVVDGEATAPDARQLRLQRRERRDGAP